MAEWGIRLGVLFLGVGLVVIDRIFRRLGKYSDGSRIRGGLSGLGVALLSLGLIIFTFFMWVNHISFPFHLDLMEGVIWQHFQRAVNFQPVYVDPGPAYVPLAYNPLYYYLSIPFSWLFGVNLFTLRFVAILGMAGSGIVLFLAVKDQTRSAWWGLAAVSLFASAYRVMDAYLDTAHSDSWLLCATLLGSYLISKNRSAAWNLAGVVVLGLAFWFKQHGALFLVGGLVFLSWREKIRLSWIYWLVAILIGPFTYIFLGNRLFGPEFVYFTWIVPRGWSQVDIHTFLRLGAFILRYYPLLAMIGVLFVGRAVLGEATRLLTRRLNDRGVRLNIWHVQLVIGLFSGLMGALDPGSSDNVFIPMGMMLILVGTIGLHDWVKLNSKTEAWQLHHLALYASLALLLFNPATVLVSPDATRQYQDLIGFLKNLDGPVYAPTLGQLEPDYTLYPAAHWVALEDMIRGPGKDTTNQPLTRKILEPAIHPAGRAYLLLNRPPEYFPWIAFLQDNYVQSNDLGDRFVALQGLPKRYDHGWPRYLFQYAGPSASTP
jgi:4-amino-4-deoxy-L-arabinose transferase-like glycosyltransferase